MSFSPSSPTGYQPRRDLLLDATTVRSDYVARVINLVQKRYMLKSWAAVLIAVARIDTCVQVWLWCFTARRFAKDLNGENFILNLNLAFDRDIKNHPDLFSGDV